MCLRIRDRALAAASVLSSSMRKKVCQAVLNRACLNVHVAPKRTNGRVCRRIDASSSLLHSDRRPLSRACVLQAVAFAARCNGQCRARLHELLAELCLCASMVLRGCVELLLAFAHVQPIDQQRQDKAREISWSLGDDHVNRTSASRTIPRKHASPVRQLTLHEAQLIHHSLFARVLLTRHLTRGVDHLQRSQERSNGNGTRGN